MAYNIRLRTARIALQLTQLDLAREVGCKELEISRFETGRAEPTEEVKGRLAEALMQPVGELFGCGGGAFTMTIVPSHEDAEKERAQQLADIAETGDEDNREVCADELDRLRRDRGA